MTKLQDYNAFQGRHWETGSIHNVLAYQGVLAPHTGKPFTEAFLLGMSGGINFGYFTFHYTGLPPQLAILTRNTFDPFETILERMGIAQKRLQTDKADKGLNNLIQILDEGKPAIIWADSYSMPYEAHRGRVDYWAMQPMIVYGHDGESAFIADRASVPLKVGAEALEIARARVKKTKFRAISLEAPSEGKLVKAAQEAIGQCIAIFTESPPRGTTKNFGLSAYQHWSDMLTNTRNKQSWKRFFPSDSGHFSAIAGHGPFPGLLDAIWAGKDGGAERNRYADFLDEGALLLMNKRITKAAELFRQSHQAWVQLAEALAPEHMPTLNEATKLIQMRSDSFIQNGAAATETIREINDRLSELARAWPANEGSDEKRIAKHRKAIQTHVDRLHVAEKKAIEALIQAMS